LRAAGADGGAAWLGMNALLAGGGLTETGSPKLRRHRGGGLPPPASTPPGPVRVDHDAPQVGVRVRAGVEPRPGPVELDQAGLDEILCCVPVPGEQHRHPQMVIAVLADIGREPLVDRAIASHSSPFGRALLTITRR
jgi:hypothetical protein